MTKIISHEQIIDYLDKKNISHEYSEDNIKKLYFNTNLSVRMLCILFNIKRGFIEKIIKKFPEKSYEQKLASRKIGNLIIYGVDNPWKDKTVREKIKNTNQKLFGGNAPICNNEIKNKYKNTCIERYGVDNPSKTESVTKKREQTSIERYGCVCTLQNAEVQEKTRQTNIERYGTESPNQAQSVKDKKAETYIKKYGVPNPACVNVKNYENRNEKYWRENFITEDGYFLIDEVLKYHGYSGYDAINKLKRMFNITEPNIFKLRSNAQKEIYEFLYEKIQTKITFNDRSVIHPLELDIYIDDLKLAIEFNGVMYHSFGEHESKKFNRPVEDPNHLLKKTSACQEKNIRLVHIWDFDWRKNKEKIKNKLVEIIENREQFEGDRFELDRCYSPLEIEGYKITGYTGPEKYIWRKDRVYFDCGKTLFEKIKNPAEAGREF
jgi:hypothetical protein